VGRLGRQQRDGEVLQAATPVRGVGRRRISRRVPVMVVVRGDGPSPVDELAEQKVNVVGLRGGRSLAGVFDRVRRGQTDGRP
jgi:hypothetical protein